MPVLCLNWETAHRHGDAWISHHRLRHRLFVERQAWNVPSYRGMEYDEFDTPAAQYLLWQNDDGVVRGAARLLPTTRPYMLEKLWPDMMPGELPRSQSVWEATRFGCDRGLDEPTRRRAVAELLSAMQEFGIRTGIRRYLAVMPPRLLERVVVSAGCTVQTLGPERDLGRLPAAAAYLTVSPAVLAEVRRRASLAGDALASGAVAAQAGPTVHGALFAAGERCAVSRPPDPATMPGRNPPTNNGP